MKKLLLLFALLIPPAMAEEDFYTRKAMSCMKEEVCTIGVEQLSSENFKGEDEREAKEILENLDKMGVKSYMAAPEYFIENYRAVYYSDTNAIFINRRYNKEYEDFIGVLRHEAWHAAQDCMGGGMVNSDLMSILSHEVIPPKIMDETFLRYGVDDPTVIRIEREAVWAMKVPDMTTKALKACNSDTPIWETYFPPKRTWQYLYWNGHI